MVRRVELRDGSLVLRAWREEDAPAVFEACRDEDILRWNPGIPRPYTTEDALAFVRDDHGFGPGRFAATVDEKLGFRREGVLRSYVRHPDGTRRDALMFSLLPPVARGIRGAGSKWVSVPLRDASGSRLPPSHQL